MNSTHDLVIIGSTYTGIKAALKAIYLKKRVALVRQGCRSLTDTLETIFTVGYSHLTGLYRSINGLETGVYPEPGKIGRWLEEVKSDFQGRHSLGDLAALGVDIIEGEGEFVRLPRLGFVTEKRKLRGDYYLITTGYRYSPAAIPGLEEVGYLGFQHLESIEKLPPILAIIGQNPIVLPIAQFLNRFGKKIILIPENPVLLPDDDGEISATVEGILESEGVELAIGDRVSQVKFIDGKKWLQVGNRAIEVDEIIYLGPYLSRHGGMNLEGVGVEVGKDRIITDSSCRTTNPKIYAVGGGSYNLDIDRTLAETVVKNIFSRYSRPLNIDTVPHVTFFEPPIVRLGLTEKQARELKEDRIKIFTTYLKNNHRSRISGNETGFCKFILENDGTILGVHAIGSGMEELIGYLSFAMKNRIPLQSLSDSVYPSFTLSAILNDIPLEGIEKKFFPPRWLQCLLNWQRY